MALPKKVTNIEDINEAFREHYTEKKSDDGEVFYELGVEGDDSASRINEFRSNNIELRKKVEDMEKRYKDIQDRFGDMDPEKYKQAQSILSKFKEDEERRLIEQGNVDQVFEMRTVEMRKKKDKEIDALRSTLEERDAQISALGSEVGKFKIDNALNAAIGDLKVKVFPKALSDVQDRARKVFELDPDADSTTGVKPRGAHYGADAKPLTMKEWLAKLTSDAPHLFESGGGGGARGGKLPGTGGVRELVDPTPLEMGKHAKAIKEGKVRVVSSGG